MAHPQDDIKWVSNEIYHLFFFQVQTEKSEHQISQPVGDQQ